MEMQLKNHEVKTLGKIKKIILEKDNFLITSHYNLDGDAIGSELALYILLKKLGKRVEIVNHDNTPAIYEFLPCADKIKTMPGKSFLNPGASIVVDCPEIERAGKVSAFAAKAPVVINIDHHFSNKSFGSVNFTGALYSATGEMVYFLLSLFGGIMKNQAECLYAALITDTGKFIYNLGPYTMKIADNLVESGAEPEKIARKIYMEKPLKSLRLLALALKTLKYEEDTGVCWMIVGKSMYKAAGAGREDTEGFVELLISRKEARAAFLLKEEDGIRASLRSKGGYDVEKIARKFGGGGHKQASGCRFENIPATAAAEKILLEIRKHYGRDNHSK